MRYFRHSYLQDLLILMDLNLAHDINISLPLGLIKFISVKDFMITWSLIKISFFLCEQCDRKSKLLNSK